MAIQPQSESGCCSSSKIQCCVAYTDLELQEVEPDEALPHGGSHQSADGGVGQDGHEELRVDAEEDGGEGLFFWGGIVVVVVTRGSGESMGRFGSTTVHPLSVYAPRDPVMWGLYNCANVPRGR